VADVKVTIDALVVALQDGRKVSVPLAWYPRLAEGTAAERREWEDMSVDALLRGLGSNESAASLRRWRASRQRPAVKSMSTRRARA
jgi:hypothetical protein